MGQDEPKLVASMMATMIMQQSRPEIDTSK